MLTQIALIARRSNCHPPLVTALTTISGVARGFEFRWRPPSRTSTAPSFTPTRMGMPAAERHPAAMDARLDGSQRDVQDAGDLFVGEVLDVGGARR